MMWELAGECICLIAVVGIRLVFTKAGSQPPLNWIFGCVLILILILAALMLGQVALWQAPFPSNSPLATPPRNSPS